MPARDDNPRSSGVEPSLDDLSLRAVAGDAGAVARLHERLTPGLVRHFARKLGRSASPPPEEAEELAQTTWIALWKALREDKYDRERARLSTFIYAVAQVVWMRHRRVRHRLRTDYGLAELAGGATAPGPGPEDAAALAAEVEVVRRVLAGSEGEFSDLDRQALRAIANGRTDRELAEDMGSSPSTAHARKKSALARLAGWLEERGVPGAGARAPGGAGAKKGVESAPDSREARGGMTGHG